MRHITSETGLFHKAVLMGMYSLNPALITQTADQNATSAFEIAKSLGYDGTVENRKKLLAFLKNTPIDTIILLKPESLLHKVIFSPSWMILKST